MSIALPVRLLRPPLHLGRHAYLCRTVDRAGDTVEFFSENSDLSAAKRFIRKALNRHSRPDRIVIDGSQTNREATLPATVRAACRIDPADC